ncbi:MAG: FIST C-terminal domain-containing protein [Solirubrobacterales bacterium]|nr:FIST C-terminal domain-containing protein [Solirubrobacterales bacterium]
MSVRIGTGLSTRANPRAGAAEAAATARDGLGGEACDLVVMFASGDHLQDPNGTLEVVREILEPDQLVGCGAAGVLGHNREIEDGTAVSVWTASLGDGWARAFHATVEPVEGGGALAGMPDLDGAAGVLLLPDPFSFPTDPVLRFLSNVVPMVPLLGGLASARTPDDGAALFHGDEVVSEGAVGVRFEDVELLPCVSQGAAPVGPELTITAAEGNVISELAGKPALKKLRETIEGLSDDDKQMVAGGLLMGIVIDVNKPDYVQGDFLVRGLAGADPDSGSIAVGTDVRPGQVVRLHARDAESADRDLAEALEIRMEALGGRTPAGALVFACNGRGRGMFGEPDHDAVAVNRILDGAPAAGFFAAGEIGPVGGEHFLHAFTATVAVFAA